MLRDGYSPDLSPLYGRPAGRLHRIPPYVFDTSSRFWFDGGVAAAAPTAQPAVVTPVAEREQPSQAPAGTRGRGTGGDRRCRRLFGRRACPVQPAR